MEEHYPNTCGDKIFKCDSRHDFTCIDKKTVFSHNLTKVATVKPVSLIAKLAIKTHYFLLFLLKMAY